MNPHGSAVSEPEWAARRLLELLAARSGVRHFQGRRTPPLPCAATTPCVRRFSVERFRRVPDVAARALVGWADGLPAELRTTVPAAEEVLRLQARGRRCVSVLPEDADRDPLEFLLHDLCHLGKFACSEHYAEQIGFFRTLAAAFASPSFRALEAELDDAFRKDRDHVASDMNGSSVFLFAAFKMKLKMAARRLAARRAGRASPARGPLSASELVVFDEVFERVLDAFGFEGRLREAAIGTSARRDSPLLASLLADHFEEIGRDVRASRHALAF